MPTSSRSQLGQAAVSALLALAAIFALPALAAAQSEAQGAELLRSVEEGERTCDDLQEADFEQVGDYLMGRMVGSPQAHESVDALTRGMMGQSGEQQMHAALGERFSGCGTGRFPAGAAGMMNGIGGMMGMMGMMGGGLDPGSGSGQDNSGQDYGPGSMMGGFGDDRAGNDGDNDHVGAGWMIVMMIFLIGGVAAVVFLVTRPRQQGSGPAELLAQRFARGEISAEDYEERRALLGGSR